MSPLTRREVERVLSAVGTLGDAADMLGVKPARVGNWAARYPDFPRPVGKFGRASVYVLAAVAAWADLYGLGPDPE